MHGNAGDRRALEREALRNVIAQWNANRLDIFELSEPNEDLEFHGVMRFYFQDSGQKVATKCIRVASDATVEDVIGTLVEKFRPDMRMLSVPSYALYELHQGCPERKMSPDEKPLLVQLNWHVDDREGRFLLRNVDDRTSNSVGMSDSNASFRRKLSKREKKQLKKQEKQQRLKSENGDNDKDGVAEKLYTELPETSFTRSISNPEAVMRRRRQQKLEKKLQQFRSKDGGPDTGGTLKIYGEALCKDVPYKTLLLSIRDCAGGVVREMLEKYGLNKSDPSQWCLVQVTQQPGVPDTEYVLDDEECPLSILMNSPNSSSIMFHVRRRPADCAPRKRKKKPGALGANAGNPRGDIRGDSIPILVELGPDGSAPLPGDTARTVRLNNDVMEVGSANGIALQLYGPHIQPRHCVITNTDGVTSLTPCHADAHTYVNGQRIHQTTILAHGSLIKFGNSNTYRFLDPSQEDRSRHPGFVDNTRIYDRSPRALSPIDHNRENFETTFDLEGNVETVSTASGPREDNRSLGSSSENRVGGMDRYPRGHDPILPAVLEFPEEPQELFLARVITHLDVTTPTFRLAPAYTLYLCARYRASTHYRPELTPTERAQKLTLLLQHAAKLVRHTVQDRSTESVSQAFWLANASELLHFLKSDRHVSAFSMQAQDTLADSVQLGFRNLVACLTDELNSVMGGLMMAETQEDHPREIINVLSNAMNLLRKCRVNAALTIQLFSQLFHWISARSLSTIINNSQLCTRSFGTRLFNRLRNLQAWAESQGLELAAECHLAKIVQCAHLLQAPKSSADELATLSAACFKLNSLQLRALLTQYKGEPGEQVAPPPLLEHAARAAEGVADELARAEGREVKLHEDSAPPLQLLLPDDGFSCDVVQGVPPGLADFLHPLQASGLCRLAAQPTSSGHWTVYMTAPRPPSALSASHTPEIQTIRLHKAGGGMGLSIVAAKGAGQERLGIYIKSVVPGGAADRDGRLAAGDQLLSVDGQSLLGITQEKAAEFLVRTGSVVTLDVAKGGAVYHGLATLLQQPSPTPHRGPRRMSERDLPSRVDAERTIPSSKSVPALHHISPNAAEQPTRGATNHHDVFNPGYSRTSSNNSINNANNNGTAPQTLSVGQNGGGPAGVNNLRSRSTHNLLQQDGGFYQNLSVYRNKIPQGSQQLGDRTSALRSSQNSLQSNITNTQRPASAYYPNSTVPNTTTNRLPLHQSIPNLKSSQERTSSYPSINQQIAQQQQYPNYNPPQQQQAYQNHHQQPYQNHHQQQQHPYQQKAVPTNQYQYDNQSINNYRGYEDQQQHNKNYQTYPHSNYPVQQPLHINANGENDLQQQREMNRYNTGLLREDYRHIAAMRDMGRGNNEEMMRYPSSNNVRIQEAQIQPSKSQDLINRQEDFSRNTEMRTSKSEDMLRQYANSNDMYRYASSGNIKDKIDSPRQQQEIYQNNDAKGNNMRGQAKLVEMGEEVRRRQNRSNQYPQHGQFYQNQNVHNYVVSPPHHVQMAQNTQSMQNLNLSTQNYYYQNATSPNYVKNPPIAPKPLRKMDDPPELPPTSTHPLYSASSQEPPKMSLYSPPQQVHSKSSRGDPWAREEQERQAEIRREQARLFREQQIKELMSTPNRTQQQEEHLRVLQLERDFQRRALEEAEQEDDDTEKESPVPSGSALNPPVVSTSSALTSSNVQQATSVVLPTPPQKQEPPASILKPGVAQVNNYVPPPIHQQEPQAPPPPERGSSYTVMSMRNKEVTKRVSFDTSTAVPQPPQTLQLEETIREDPNSFIRQAETMLASPTTPNESAISTATPGVIGAQEVYKDPRTRRLAEQAQQKAQAPIPEKLSFKEKMKMFAMETGEAGTPKDKSKISRAQREIDNLASPNSSLVH
ncbi:afadin isoform X2 [Onthophagus taurus]